LPPINPESDRRFILAKAQSISKICNVLTSTWGCKPEFQKISSMVNATFSLPKCSLVSVRFSPYSVPDFSGLSSLHSYRIARNRIFRDSGFQKFSILWCAGATHNRIFIKNMFYDCVRWPLKPRGIVRSFVLYIWQFGVFIVLCG